MRTLSIVLALLVIAPAPEAAQVAPSKEPGITGVVLAPDGSPVTQGAVTLMTSATHRVNAAIDRTGHFRILPDSIGWQRLFISVPGLAPYRLNLTVPSSRIMALPEITLGEATYFRARLVTAGGEPLGAGGLRRRVIDGDGLTIPDPLGHVREHVETDGTLTIGPLPPGRMLMAVDRAPLAQTRLRDVVVTADRPVIEGGVIAIATGGRLLVDVVDGGDRAIPYHDVWLDDAASPSPLVFPMVKTDQQGRAMFDRLASGRYRVWTRTAERCRNQWLTISRLVVSSGSGEEATRLVVGGRASLRVMSPLGPVTGRSVFLSPESSTQPPWQPRSADLLPRLRHMPVPVYSPPSCGGATDADGRFTMTPFPPGPAQLRVSLFNSSYVARVTIPAGGREMVVAIPDGLLPVRVTDQAGQQPTPGARLTWVGGGGRVEAFATANGDALLEAVGATGGTLTISARDHETLEGRFDETPGVLQEVALKALPRATVAVRVMNDAGDALAGAVIELMARNPHEVAEFTVADSKGLATFAGVPPGHLQFTARAPAFAPATVRVPEENRGSITIALTRNR